MMIIQNPTADKLNVDDESGLFFVDTRMFCIIVFISISVYSCMAERLKQNEQIQNKFVSFRDSPRFYCYLTDDDDDYNL